VSSVDTSIIQYLINFGWADAQAHPDDYKAALKLFKMVFKLDSDDQVHRLMLAPRCGCSDAEFRGRGGRSNVAKWPKNQLTLSVKNAPQYLGLSRTKEICLAAAREWSAVCNLRFDIIEDHAASDICVFFQAIDGASNTLGFTYLPMGQKQLPLQLDTAEKWLEILNITDPGIYLHAVMAHELGHTIGLPHGSGLMAAYYNASILRPQPGYDIDESVKRYGPVVVEPSPYIPPAPDNGEILTFHVPLSQLVIDGYGLIKRSGVRR